MKNFGNCFNKPLTYFSSTLYSTPGDTFGGVLKIFDRILKPFFSISWTPYHKNKLVHIRKSRIIGTKKNFKFYKFSLRTILGSEKINYNSSKFGSSPDLNSAEARMPGSLEGLILKGI